MLLAFTKCFCSEFNSNAFLFHCISLCLQKFRFVCQRSSLSGDFKMFGFPLLSCMMRAPT